MTTRVRSAEFKAYNREYANRPERVAQRRRFKLAQYGLTPEEYDEMLVKQCGLCAICGEPEAIAGRSLSVDHCHRTDSIRSLLCFQCNVLLGNSKDSPELLIKAAAYLRAHIETDN